MGEKVVIHCQCGHVFEGNLSYDDVDKYAGTDS